MLTLGLPLEPDTRMLGNLFSEILERSRWSNDGPLVQRLEAQTGERLRWAETTAVASGTVALTTALLALDLPPNAEVITTPLTFRATPLAIEAAGLRPVFAGVDPETLLLDPGAVAQALSPRTGAILPVHLFGVAVDPTIDELATAHNLPVVYDAAHAFDLDLDAAGRGSATAYSLHATKLLHTGEGGLICTDHPDIAEHVRRVRNFGLDGPGPGINAKLPELSAAVGLAMMERLDAEIQTRLAIRARYTEALSVGTRADPHAANRTRSVVMEVIRCHPEVQLDIVNDLAQQGVQARRFPALSSPGERYAAVPLYGATRRDIDELAHSVIALPIHSGVQESHLKRITEVLGRRVTA